MSYGIVTCNPVLGSTSEAIHLTTRTMIVHTYIILFLHTFLVIATSITKSVEGSLFKDLFGGNDAILFARLRCLLALQRTGFDLGNFASYPKSFHDDSTVELAQAGMYQGASNIEEYVKFAYAGYSPYLACCNRVTEKKFRFVGYNNGQCEFLGSFTRSVQFISNTTAAPLEPFRLVAATKLYLDFEERYITRVNVFFTEDFLRIFFDLILNSSKTRQFVCGIVNGVCASTLNRTANASNRTCEEQLQTFPSMDEQYHFDGKSQGCRALHAVFAATNPENHCAHLSFIPLEDPLGKVKCQTSKGALPSSLFTERELQMIEDFARSVGIDPAIGHTYVG